MDKALEKFGIYDFMGIWIPGALTVTYYLFTLRSFFYNLFSSLGITQNGLSGGFLLIILYTAVAFIVGVILHEIGKILADYISWFRLSDINSRILNKEISNRPSLIFKRIRYEYQQAIKQIDLNAEEIIEFDEAISWLKYNESVSTKRIDTYHAIYALSRSLCLCFMGNIVLLLLNWLCFSTTPNIWLIIFDIFMSLLFFIRTYRYFHSWVKNVYLQYYSNIKDISNSKALEE